MRPFLVTLKVVFDWSASVLACNEREARKPYRGVATGTVALQSFAMKRAGKSPIFRCGAKSGFDWVVFDVFDDINKMPSVADITIKWLVLPKLSPTIQQFIRLMRCVGFYRMRDLS